jgi:SpoVK/Ycf46/Vps4 family AAA+-type ATPase
MEDFDDSFLRPSRIDLRLEIPLPNKGIREEYFNHKKLSKEIIPELVEKTENFSLADLKELYICINILEYKIDDAIQKIKNVVEKKNYLDKNSEEKSLAI